MIFSRPLGEALSRPSPVESLHLTAEFYDQCDLRYPMYIAGAWTEDDFPADGCLALYYYLSAILLEEAGGD